MIWFKYTSLTTSEIFEKINYISTEPFPWIFFIIISTILIFLNIYYFFPIILFSVEHLKKEHSKKQKKIMIRQIALQREVEDEIEKSFIKK
jgi:hypothetical protein